MLAVARVHAACGALRIFREMDYRYPLCNPVADPRESRDPEEEHPERVRNLIQGMARALESMDAVFPVQEGRELEPIVL